MPTTYTHWRFGDQCINTLPKKLKNIVLSNREIFDYGVHGPDIYFYYKCLRHNKVNQFGTDLHNLPFKEILKQVKPHFQEIDQKDAALSYLIGFCCHFTLDSYCHGYIQRKDEISKFTHARIETELDRHFLVKDGYDPIKKRLTFSLKPTHKMAKVISTLLPKWDEETTYQALKDQRFYLNFIKDTNSAKRFTLSRMMEVAGAKYYKDMMMTTKNYPSLEDAMMRLDKCYQRALEHYPKILKSMVDYLIDDKPLDKYFRFHFDYRSDYKKIPILSVEEEKDYVVELQS